MFDENKSPFMEMIDIELPTFGDDRKKNSVDIQVSLNRVAYFRCL